MYLQNKKAQRHGHIKLLYIYIYTPDENQYLTVRKYTNNTRREFSYPLQIPKNAIFHFASFACCHCNKNPHIAFVNIGLLSSSSATTNVHTIHKTFKHKDPAIFMCGIDSLSSFYLKK